MVIWPKQNPDSLNKFYGNPDANKDGMPDPRWESENIVRVVPAYAMTWSWSGTPVKTIAVHRKCATSLNAILNNIGVDTTSEERKKFQLDRCGGAYNFRLMRGSNRLSTHSWGCAIDLAPEINYLGRDYDPAVGMMPMKIVHIFQKYGWVWGGKFSRGDAMHFQAAKI